MTTRSIPFLDLKAQQARIAGELRRRLDGVLAHCQFILGPEVAELETELATFCGAKHCVAVSSGTDALQIAFMAEGIGKGDAVFLPAFTYTATAEVPLVLGATPVLSTFADWVSEMPSRSVAFGSIQPGGTKVSSVTLSPLFRRLSRSL